MAWFKRKNKQKDEAQVVPKHIAFIADGNGRWATEKGLPRFEGHKSGKEAIKKVLDRCFERGVEVVSLYCFSTENFNRPKEEVEYILAGKTFVLLTTKTSPFFSKFKIS